jgi:type III pantothenate kinase
MLLAINIGNTNVWLGVFEGQSPAGHWRLSTDASKTEDEYGLLLLGVLERGKIDPGHISGVILSSVVPRLDSVFAAVVQNLFSRPPLIVSTQMDTGLRLSYRNPTELGTDRLVNAAAAYERYKTDLIVVDLGTATTFSAVSRDGEYLGGAIAPGLAIAAEALFTRTAKLPRVELLAPAQVIGRDTISSLQSGIVVGHAAMVDNLVSRMQQELSVSSRIIATGGNAAFIAPISQTIQDVRPFLTLEGLELLYRRAITR